MIRRYNVRFKIGNRWGAASSYTAKEICVHLVDKYSFTEPELDTLFGLEVGKCVHICEMEIRRYK